MSRAPFPLFSVILAGDEKIPHLLGWAPPAAFWTDSRARVRNHGPGDFGAGACFVAR